MLAYAPMLPQYYYAQNHASIFRQGLTSNHLEYASTIISVLPRTGSVWSTWMRLHGFSGQSQGCIGTFGGFFRLLWQMRQCLTLLSKSASIRPVKAINLIWLRLQTKMRDCPQNEGDMQMESYIQAKAQHKHYLLLCFLWYSQVAFFDFSSISSGGFNQ